MTIDQNGSNARAVNFGGIELPPTQPIDMTTLLTGEVRTADAHGMPHPVAASSHANRASAHNPIAEWLGALSPQADNQLPDRPHRQYRKPTHD
jgi:hypothetical protein